VGRGGDEPPALPADGVVVFYFHTNRRCPECDRIRAWARETVESDFADALRARRLFWRVVNIASKPNRHFADDYKLYAATVVLSERRGGREVRWKNLERVWDLVADQPRFKTYVRDEVTAFLKGA